MSGGGGGTEALDLMAYVALCKIANRDECPMEGWVSARRGDSVYTSCVSPWGEGERAASVPHGSQGGTQLVRACRRMPLHRRARGALLSSGRHATGLRAGKVRRRSKLHAGGANGVGIPSFHGGPSTSM